MLRVTVVDDPGELRLRLEGRLAGPWVQEVELCWQTMRSLLGGRSVTVDLRDVDFIDSAGEQALASMHKNGAILLATGPLTTNVVARITHGQFNEIRPNLHAVCRHLKQPK